MSCNQVDVIGPRLELDSVVKQELAGSGLCSWHQRLIRGLERVCAVAAVAVTAFGCSPDREPDSSLARPPAPSTMSMSERLGEILEQATANGALGYMADLQLQYFNDIPLPDDPRGRMRLLEQRALAGLQSGATLSALENLVKASGLAEELDDREARLRIATAKAVSHLRQGEQDNCLVGSEGVCILPLVGHAVHSQQRGARDALPLLIELADSGDLSSLWLANLASMALGDWPEALPPRLQLPPDVFEDGTSWPRFSNTAGLAGVDELGVAGGVVLDDLDGDGKLDLVTSTWGLRGRLRFYRNCAEDTLRFCDVTEATGVSDLPGGLNLIHADYDNDGDLDIYVLRGAWLGPHGRLPNSLLRNDGGWFFTDVTESSGLLDYLPTQTASWADYDLDGILDLFVGAESVGGQSMRSRLYRGGADGKFTRTEASVGLLAVGFIKGSAWGDANSDGLPDLYVSRLGQPNQLWLNTPKDGAPRFIEVAEMLGVAEPMRSFAVGFADFNGDSRDDILALPFAATDFRSAGLDTIVAHSLAQPQSGATARVATSVAATGEAGPAFRQGALGDLDRPMLAMAANVGDLNGDGWLDLYVGTGAPSMGALTPNRLLVGSPNGDWEDASFSAGLAHLQKGHGIAFGDVDSDGDRDIYVVLGGAYSGDVARNVLFENPGFGNAWVALKLVGTSANRSAIGARVRLEWSEKDASGDTVQRSVTRVVNTGMSFGSSTLTLEVGLGQATAIDQILVQWPTRDLTGGTQQFSDVAVNASYRLEQGGLLSAASYR